MHSIRFLFHRYYILTLKRSFLAKSLLKWLIYLYLGGAVMEKIVEDTLQEQGSIAWFAMILIFVSVVRRQRTGLLGKLS